MGRELREQVGRCLFLGVAAVEPDDGLRRFLDDLRPGGIILFPRNLRDPDQVARLNERLRGEGADSRLVGVDQEGGRVERLRHLLGPLPPAAELAREGAGAVREFARLLGETLRSLGFGLNFAPVVDLSRPGAPNGIGDRAFGEDPEGVAALGRAYLEGLGEAGLLGVLKHFPGLGPTRVDSHRALPRVDRREEEFRRRDLIPFRELARLAPAVLVGHAHYPFLDREPRPASASRAVLEGLLRRELGFTGVAIADDLEMGAVDQGRGWAEAAAATLAAGCDMLLVCHTLPRMRALRDHLVAAVEAGRIPVERVATAAGRVDALGRRAPRPQAGSVPAPGPRLAERFGRH